MKIDPRCICALHRRRCVCFRILIFPRNSGFLFFFFFFFLLFLVFLCIFCAALFVYRYLSGRANQGYQSCQLTLSLPLSSRRIVCVCTPSAFQSSFQMPLCLMSSPLGFHAKFWLASLALPLSLLLLLSAAQHESVCL